MPGNRRRGLFGTSRRRPSVAEMVVGEVLDRQAEKRNRRERLKDEVLVDTDLPVELQSFIKWTDYKIKERGHDTECWVWQKRRVIDDPITGGRRDVREIIYHRLSREELPKGSELIARCGNYDSRGLWEGLRSPLNEDPKPYCINPDHFTVVSKAENNVINQIRHRKTPEITPEQRQTIAALGERRDWTEKERCLIFDVLRPYLRDDAQAYKDRSVLKYVKNDFAGALADCDQSIALDPDQRRVDFLFLRRGRCKVQLGDYAGAIADFDQAIALDPEHGWVYSNRAHANLELENWAGAIVDLDRAIEIDPKSAADYSDRGVAKDRAGDSAGAIADFEQAIALNPDYELARSNLESMKAYLEGRAETNEPPHLPVHSDLEAELEPQEPASAPVPVGKKSRTVAGWLAFLLGGIGAHKFYLGYPGAGFVHLLVSLTIIGAPINAFICIIEFLIYMTKTDEEFHQTYVVNRKRFF